MTRKRDDYREALRAIRDFDVKAMKKLVNNGFYVRQLTEDEYLCLDIRRNLFPEADNPENLTDWDKQEVKMISDKLAKGHEILKILAEAGLVLIDSWENYSLYGIDSLNEPFFDIDGEHLPLETISYEHVHTNRSIRNTYPSLRYAVSPEALKIMLSEGLDVNAKDSVGWTALHYVAYFYYAEKGYFKRCEMAKILLEAGADVNSQSIDGITPLMLSLCSKYDVGIVLVLIANGADVKIMDKYKHPLEFWNRKSYSFIQELIDHKLGLSNLSDTVLHEILDSVLLLSEKLEAIKLFLDAGANINAQDINGETVLMCAARDNNEDLLKFLLSNGADPMMKNNEGKSALDILLDNKKPKSLMINNIILLLKAGIPINDYEDFNFRLPAAHREMEKFGFEQVDSFVDLIRDNPPEDLIQAVKSGFDMDVSDVDDLRLIEAAVQLGKIELVKECLNNCEAGLIEMLLLRELEKYDVQSLKTMLSAGADVNYIKTLGWHFVSNYIPEANNPDDKAAIELKLKLDKGSEILSVLHEYDPDIPNKDNNDRALSYLSVQEDYGDPDDDLEFIPVKYDDISVMRHAVSPMALSEIIDSVSDVNSMAESKKLRFPRTTREEIRRSFTPEDFIDASNDDDDEDDVDDIFGRLSQMFSPEDFVTGDDNDSNNDDDCNDKEVLEPQFPGKTILHVIAKNCDEYFNPAGIIEILCYHGADRNARNFASLTPAELLAENHKDSGHALECLYAFIRAGVRNRVFLDLVGSNNFDCLTSSVFTDILAAIVYNPNNVNNSSDINNIKLLIAAFNNDIFRISQALSDGADVNTNTIVGYTPLMIAAMFGSPETIKFLLDNGADINTATSYSGEKALNLSVRASEGTLKMNGENIRVLVENGADINFRDVKGNTPLIAAIFNHLDGLDVLLSLGADVNIKANNGASPLSVAIENHDTKALRELLKAGANPEALCLQGD